MSLDAILAQRFVVDRARLEEIRREAELARLPFVQALVVAGICAEDELAAVLAEAVGSVVLDLAAGAVELQALALLPEAVARRHLVIPVSHGPSHRSLRVAFANPLDEEAIAAVQQATALPVECLVASATGVLHAIDREYARPSTKVVGRPALRPEDTRRVSLPRSAPASEHVPDVLDASITVPAHRLDREASPELRHEALLLALIERGAVTRADYLEALKRLLGPRE